MSFIGAAIAGVAAIAGSAISSSNASDASQAASQAQQQANQQSNQTQRDMFAASAGLNTPGRNLGYGADSLLAQLYGIPDPNSSATTGMYPANSALNAFNGGGNGSPGYSNFGGFNLNGINGPGLGIGKGAQGAPTAPSAQGPSFGKGQYQNFFNSPGYQFTQSQGQQAIDRQAAAGGGLYTPNTSAELAKFTEGTAAGQYNNYVQQLMGLAGIGGTAVAGTQNAATTAGNNISQGQINAGNANASGVLGSASAESAGINNASNIIGNYFTKYGSGLFGGSSNTSGAGGFSNLTSGNIAPTSGGVWDTSF